VFSYGPNSLPKRWKIIKENNRIKIGQKLAHDLAIFLPFFLAIQNPFLFLSNFGQTPPWPMASIHSKIYGQNSKLFPFLLFAL
jgi:hypothetical protein